MSNRKHIDRVFQEKLKDFEVSPSPKVWKNIKGELEQSNQNKKVIPIWYRIVGVAALLFLLLAVGNLIVSNISNSNSNNVVDTENIINPSDSEVNGTNNNKTVEDLQNTNIDDVLTEVNSQDLNYESTNQTIDNKSIVNTNPSGSDSNLLNNTSISETKSNASNNSKVAKTEPSESNTKLLNNSNRVVLESNTSKKTNSSEDKNNYSSAINKETKGNQLQSNAVTQRNNTDATTTQISDVVAQNKTSINKGSEKVNESNNTSAVNNNDVSDTNRIQGIAQNNSEKQNNNSNVLSEFDKDKGNEVMKNDTKDGVVENQSNLEVQDNIEGITMDAEAEKDSPSIEEEIAKTEDIIEKEEEKLVNRWQVYANIAPVYYNTLGKGSHIDDQFVQNSKSGEINTSYGVNVSYVLNDKFKLRSGFNSLDLSYDTDNVILYENVGNNPNSSPRNLDLTTTGQSFSAISANNLGAQQLSNVIGENANAAISQRIAYYEVPLELEYNLVDNKFGVNVIGGFSTFILNDNKVYSEFDGYKTEVGEANNINNVSFSGNLGLGLDYKFSKKIKLNVQPTFKYQLNAYKNTSGNFRPYIVGVYTGLSYKF